MTGPTALPQILEINPYKGGEKIPGAHKLSSNENPLGCSPAAQEAANHAAASMNIYPDGGATELRAAIGAKYGIDADRIVCGTGSDEIFQLLSRAFLKPGDEVIQSEFGFLVYRLVTQQAGATLISAPEKNLTTDVDAILERVTDKTKIVFIANPNNPTGSYIPFEEVKRLHAGLREDILLVLDGAYAEYVRKNDYAAGMELAGEAPNVMITRTFSKIHGLGGLRLGWAYGPASVIDALNRTRGPFNVSSLALEIGVAALADDAFQAKSADHNEKELARIGEALTNLGYTVHPSVGNFFLLQLNDREHAMRADAFLRSRNIVVRDILAYGLGDYLRVTVGTVAQNDDVISALEAFAKR